MLALFNVVLVVIGALSAGVTGYGGTIELVIGILVLTISIGLFVICRVGQDRLPFQWRAPKDS